jgi:type VI protein secretion system component VasK
MKEKLKQIIKESNIWMISALALPAAAVLIWLGVHYLGSQNTRHLYALVILSTFAVAATTWWWWAMFRFSEVTRFIISTNNKFDEVLKEIKNVKQDVSARKRTVKKTTKDSK